MTPQATSIAELKTYGASMANNDTITVLGYYAAGDLGGGTFYWDSASTEADDGGMIIQATGVTTGRWIRIYDSVINVRWFGARGIDAISDGTHYDYDDAPAINAAVLAANSRTSETLGNTVFLPAGKYPIKQPVKPYIGTKFIGEGSGLGSIDPSPSNGTVMLLAVHNPDNTAWATTTLNSGDVTVNYQIMFLTYAGICDAENINFGVQNNDSTKSVCFWLGADKNPYDNSGLPQADFRRIRAFSFNSVFQGSRMADIYFDACGFEYNIHAFKVMQGYTTANVLTQGVMGGMHFSNCVLFGNYVDFITITEGKFENLSFQGCEFSAPTAPGHLAFFQCTQDISALKDIRFTACAFDAYGANTGDKVFYMETSNPTVEGIVFTGCSFTDVKLQVGYTTPTASFKYLVVTGCVLENTPIIADYEVTDFNISNNIFIGDSYLLMKGANRGVINGNNFFAAVHSQTYDIGLAADINQDFVVVGNLCTTKGFATHASSARYKVLSNLNVTDATNP
jgi:hypothetical protein